MTLYARSAGEAETPCAKKSGIVARAGARLIAAAHAVFTPPHRLLPRRLSFVMRLDWRVDAPRPMFGADTTNKEDGMSAQSVIVRYGAAFSAYALAIAGVLGVCALHLSGVV